MKSIAKKSCPTNRKKDSKTFQSWKSPTRSWKGCQECSKQISNSNMNMVAVIGGMLMSLLQLKALLHTTAILVIVPWSYQLFVGGSVALPWRENGRSTKKSHTKWKHKSLVCDSSAKHSALSAMVTAGLYFCATDAQRKA